VDSDPRTLQMKPDAMRSALSNKTVAVCPVHVLGNAVPMDAVMRFAEENDPWIVEDTCEALGAATTGNWREHLAIWPHSVSSFHITLRRLRAR